MSDFDTFVILRPRSTNAYGQDFLDADVGREPDFATVRKREGYYPIDDLRRAKTIVGQNPDDSEESRTLNYLGRTMKTAVFVHCQWEYYDDRQRANVAQALETATIGITPARFLADRMGAMFPHVRWQTVSGCVNTRFFSPSVQKDREEFRHLHGLAGDEKLALFTGRLETAKGTQILKDLCACSHRSFAVMVQYPASQAVQEKATLFQSYLNICRELSASPKVIFFPDRDQRATPRPIRFADVAISPSLSEVQPLVLLEALASGVPYVGTNSTPEYADLCKRFSDSPELSGVIEITDLPDYLRQGAIPRATGDIQESDSQKVANGLIEAINKKEAFDDGARVALSDAFLSHGFTVPDRTRRFREVLEDRVWEDAQL